MSWDPLRFTEVVRQNPGFYLGFKKVLQLASEQRFWDDIDELRRIDMLQLGAKFPTMVRIVFNHVGVPALWDDAAAALSGMSLANLAERLPESLGFLPNAPGEVKRLLDNLAGGNMANLGPDHMRALYGKAQAQLADGMPFQWISITDVVRGCGAMVAIARREADEIAGGNGTAIYNALFNVENFASFAGIFFTRSGYEWGVRAEMRILCVRLKDAPNAVLRLGVKLSDGRLGPDIVEYIQEGGKAVGRITQSKALKDPRSMAANWARAASTKQLFSDMRRLGAQNWKLAGQGADGIAGSPGAVTVGVSKFYDFVFDYDHFILKSDDIIGEVSALATHYNISFAGTSDMPWQDLEPLVKAVLKEAMARKGAELTAAVRGLKQTAGEGVETLTTWHHVINNHILDNLPDGATFSRLDLADMTPQALIDQGVISAQELAELGANASQAKVLRKAMKNILGLSQEAIDEMPNFTIGMKVMSKSPPAGYL